LKLTRKIKRLFYRISKDSAIATELKSKFAHKKKTCHYAGFRAEVDCLVLEAASGVIETIVTDLCKTDRKEKTKFLNLGGGLGQLSALFEEMGFDVTNTDIEIERTDSRNIKVDFNEADSLPLPENSFDVVLCQEVIEHIENPWRLLRMARKYIKEGGIFYLTTPNIHSVRSKRCFAKTDYFTWFEEKNHSYHINPLAFWEIEMIAEKSGYELVSLKGSGDYFFARDNDNKRKVLKNNDILIFKFLAGAPQAVQ